MSGAQREAPLDLGPATRRLVALGDPHGDLLGLDEVFAREDGPGVAYVSVGDNVGYADGATSSHLVAMLQQRGIPSVAGNHEEGTGDDGRLEHKPFGLPPAVTAEALAWLRALPRRLRVSAPARPDARIVVVHSLPGWGYVKPESAERLLDVEEADVVICGHTHRAAVYAVSRDGVEVSWLSLRRKTPLRVPWRPGVRYVVDAGSLGRPAGRRGGPQFERSSYAVVDLAAGAFELHAVDKGPRLRALFAEAGHGP